MSRPPKPLIERKMPIPAAHSSLQHSEGGRLARRARHRLLLRDRPRDRRATGRRGLDGVRERAQAEGAVGVLVNNAGYSQSGAVEAVSLEEARRQFETNVFGLARLTQLVLPGMRREGWGRIVNVSSMGG